MAGVVLLAACSEDTSEVDRALSDLNVIDETNLNEVMLNVADPNEGVAHFQRTLEANPDRIDIRRGLAISLIRAKRKTEAVLAWRSVTEHEESVNDDFVHYADALIRNNEWDAADEVLDTIPPTHETFKRYRLEAMIADSNENWEKADSFYETAVGLTTQPAGVLNNWGYSKLSRGDFAGAERLFGDAVRRDSSLFTAKNNLVLARGAQKKYSLPVLETTQVERAQLLYTLGLSAVKQGDTTIGKGLLRDAVDTHPQYFEAAARSLEALENG
ncbi:MAG: tetratricopeptide repeat protein [Pseudomonadota bacterium]